jgi:polyisoprenoid-binding protein YceI
MATYSIDTTHSEISFTVRHMMFAKVRGQFKAWTAVLDYNAENPAASKVSVDIDLASIDTGEAQRDTHLKSGDFFDAAKFPKITFQSKRVEASGKASYKLTGDLTIRDATHEVTLEVESTGTGKDPWGNTRLGFSLKGAISRSEYGLKWNQVLETGGMLVSDNVDIGAELEVVAKA